jgi:hypothetical protein
MILVVLGYDAANFNHLQLIYDLKAFLCVHDEEYQNETEATGEHI